MRIEAVTTCVNYSDFLSHVLPYTGRQFDHLIVVTTPEDTETQRVCDFFDVHCVTTDVFYSDGPFCKGKGINYGLSHLKLDGWVVHLDSDIVLPPTFSGLVRKLPLDPKCIYGIDRVNCRSWDDWVRWVPTGLPQLEKDHLLHVGPWQTGARLVRRTFGGYTPIGFFQMWNPVGSGITKYAEDHTDAARGDVDFALGWDRCHRWLIPEVVAFHLESEEAPKGANWEGRKTKKFGPPDKAEEPVVTSRSYEPVIEDDPDDDDDEEQPEPGHRIGFPPMPPISLKHAAAAGAVAGSLSLIPFLL